MISKHNVIKILIIFLLLLLGTIGYFLVSNKINPKTQINFEDLRNKLNPEVRACIVKALGIQESQKLAQTARQTGKINNATLTKIQPCFDLFTDTGEEGKDLTLPPLKDKKPTNDKNITQIGSGIIEGYQYWLYENSQYPCGKSGNYQFLVLQKGSENNQRHLLIRFHGGAAGFYYNKGNSYWPEEKFAYEMLYADREQKTLFSAALGDGLAKLIRENQDWRILVPSYCSHDFYFGKGQNNPEDGFNRWGYNASKEAIDFTDSQFLTDKIVATGTSAGASGAFYHGYQRSKVVGIMMDSWSMDMNPSTQPVRVNNLPLQTKWPVECDGVSCIKTLTERIGYIIGQDNPSVLIEKGKVFTPIYFIWDTHDSMYNYNAEPVMANLQKAIQTYNPGSRSVAKEVCVSNPANPKRTCTIHSPTKFDLPETEAVYQWILSLVK